MTPDPLLPQQTNEDARMDSQCTGRDIPTAPANEVARMKDKVITVHTDECECDYCTMSLDEYTRTHGFECSGCGHRHECERLAFICIGCPCPRALEWLQSVGAVARSVGGSTA